jgi:uncharacterized protein (TIGR02678 family)
MTTTLSGTAMELDVGDRSGEVTSHRVARTIRETDLAEYQRVVRTLLAEPFVRPNETERLASLRRFEVDIRTDLESIGRYRLELSSTTALLVKRPVVFDPYRSAKSTNVSNRPFDPRRYAYLCLALSTLFTAGVQILLSSIARRLTDEAHAVSGLGFDADTFAQRTAFVDVIRWLVERGVLRLRDGSAAVDLEEDALYDIDHEVLHVLAPSLGLRDVSSIAERLVESFGEGRDERRAQLRQRVLRLLLDRPVVLYSDLDGEERSWLQRNGARVDADLHRLTGMQVERRREGIALIDTEGDASARVFPRGGSSSQLALLLGDRLLQAVPPDRLVPFPRLREATERYADSIDIAVTRLRETNGSPTEEPSAFPRNGHGYDTADMRGDDLEFSSEAKDSALRPPGDTQTVLAVEAGSQSEPFRSPNLRHGELRPEDRPAEATVSGSTVAPLFVPGWSFDEVLCIITELVEQFPVKRDLKEDPKEAARVALDELFALDLIRMTFDSAGETFVVTTPPLARYRLVSPPAAESVGDQLDFFGGAL